MLWLPLYDMLHFICLDIAVIAPALAPSLRSANAREEQAINITYWLPRSAARPWDYRNIPPMRRLKYAAGHRDFSRILFAWRADAANDDGAGNISSRIFEYCRNRWWAEGYSGRLPPLHGLFAEAAWWFGHIHLWLKDTCRMNFICNYFRLDNGVLPFHSRHDDDFACLDMGTTLFHWPIVKSQKHDLISRGNISFCCRHDIWNYATHADIDDCHDIKRRTQESRRATINFDSYYRQKQSRYSAGFDDWDHQRTVKQILLSTALFAPSTPLPPRSYALRSEAY